MTHARVLPLFLSATLSLCISATAMADDLEIYLGSGGTSTTYNPNVLFIMDTSGSMTSQDDTGESRMLRVQNALKETLETVTNVNAGLMRFSDYGGPILYPIRDLNETVSPEIIRSVASSASDVYEVSGTINSTADYVRLTYGTNTVYTGLHYENMSIPQGATITNAYVRFTSNTYNAADATLTFKGELVDDASTFTTTSSDVSDRTTTSSSVAWSSDNIFPVSGETTSSPDLTSVIQEIVNQSGWCGGNSLNLIVEGTSSSSYSNRQAISFDEGSGLGPQIVVEYDDTTATGCVTGSQIYQVDSRQANVEETKTGYDSTGDELTFNASYNSYVGLVFKDVALPQGASIKNAYLIFTAYQNRLNSGASMVISASNEADPSVFKGKYSRYELRNATKTAGVTWSDIDPWYKNSTYDSPSVTSVVETLVNRSDWESGNNMLFILSDFTGDRGAYSYQGKPSAAPQLVIEYEGNATAGSSSTVRELLISKVDELSASGYTPIVDTLYEGVSYFGGMDVYYGLTRGTSSTSSTVRKNTRVSHRASYTGSDSVLPTGCTSDNLSASECVNEYIPTGATYISPIEDVECQTNNHIVLLSDGEANYNHSADEISTLLGASCTSASDGEKCGLDLVENVSDSDESVIGSRIITHTIGFETDSTASTFLNNLALKSGGGFYEVDNTEDLVTAFQSILKTVKDVNATFVSPGVAVNQLNRLTHNDELYYALFKPAEGTMWPGNLKKYKISGDTILDQNGLNAVDSETGFFSEYSHSYWSTIADGNDVREGGAASKLDLVRNVYTFSSAGSIMVTDNELTEDNTTITTTDLALDSTSDPTGLRDTVLKWARGVDIKDDDNDGDTTDVRLQMGDPIHSQPVIANYSGSDSAIFVATNHGFLHSFDPETGEENFAIIPKELLSNLYEFYQDNSSYNHIYGLDGDMVLRTVGSSMYLYVGMRRGGQNYYVFDVTSKSSPSLLFKVEGGSGDFAKLGQTWSRPTLTKVRIGSVAKNVMIVGGGYDETQDDKTLRTDDVIGNAVYMIDADTGELLWSASNSDANLVLDDMVYSIPARISVVDRDNDGYADHMYVADMGGQVFRLDIHNGSGASDLVSGGILARFSGEGTADNRHFYYGPDIAEISLVNEHYYAVAIGSGYRAHPLDTAISDNFYMIKDTGVFEFDDDGNYTLPSTPYGESDLYDATDHLLTSSDGDEAEIEASKLSDANGWYIQLDSGGEKVLASPLILNYQVIFTTYVPATASDSSCAPATGNSRAYLVSLVNGNAVTDLDGDGVYEDEDRYAQLKQTGIAPDTKILIEDITSPVVCLGTECASAVIKTDEDGNEEECTNEFECLSQNVYGRFDRVIKGSWNSETERD